MTDQPFGADVRATIRIGLTWLTIVLTGLFLVFSHKGMVPLLAVWSVGLIATAPWRSAWPLRLPPPALIIALFVLLAAISLAWAIDQTRTLEQTLKLGLTSAFGFLGLAAAARTRLWEDARWHKPVALCGVLLVVFLGIELATLSGIRRMATGESDALLNKFDQRVWGAAGLSILAWPCAYALWRWRGRWAALLFLVVVAVEVSTSRMSAAALAFAVGGAASLGAAVAPLTAIRLWIAGAVSTILLAPALASLSLPQSKLEAWCQSLPQSLAHRLFIWERAAERAFEKPFGGWGFDASRSMPDSKEVIACIDWAPAVYISLHPHNFALQVWLELGLAGAVLAALFAHRLGCVALALRDRPVVIAVLPVMASYSTIGMLSYGAWQSWWVVTGWALAFILAALAGADRTRAAAQPS